MTRSITQGQADAINNASQALQNAQAGTAIKEVLENIVAEPDVWTAQAYTAGAQVIYNEFLYYANTSAISSDVPGVSSVWTKVGSGNVLSVGGNTGVVTELKTGSIAIVDTTTATKKIAFAASGATAATTMTLTAVQTADRAITLPDATDTLVGKATTDTLTNKTLTSPTINAPTMTTPVLGVATATTVNKVTITPPATSAVLTIAEGATLSAPASATISGTNTGDNINLATFSGTLANHLNDTAAAIGGIAVGSLYRNGSVVQIRVS